MAGRMGQTLSEYLTSQFYAWEVRGRGWQVWERPVGLEPVFVPFLRRPPSEHGDEDDGRYPGLIERLWERFSRRLGGRAGDSGGEADEGFEEPEPLLSEEGAHFAEIRVQVSPNTSISLEQAERVLLALAGTTDCTSFELVGDAKDVALLFAVRLEDQGTALSVLGTYLPDAVLTIERGTRLDGLIKCANGHLAVADFGLAREFMLPLASQRSLALDPLLDFLSVMASLTDGEEAALQVLFARTSYPWAESMARAATDGRGHSFFSDVPEFPRETRAKLERPLMAAVIRVAARSGASPRAWEIARRLGLALGQFGSPNGNEFIALDDAGYPEEEHAADFARRLTRRSGMILSSGELAGLVHPPSGDVRMPGLVAPTRRTKCIPAELAAGELVLGLNRDRGSEREVRVNGATRLRHMHVVGATGSGKSTLLLGLIRQDLAAGRGVCVIDPHGDLADAVLESVTERREGDVVVFDPSDREAPVGFNPLRVRNDRDREVLASDLVAAFRRLATSWGDQMSAVLGNAVLALIDGEAEGTLLDLRQFLIDRGYRSRALTQVRDPLVRSFWTEEYPQLAGRPQVPILTRLDALLRPPSLRGVLVQREGRLDLGAVMERGQILIVRLAQGAIGEENAYLLGTLLISRIHQLALAREGTEEKSRRPFFLYIDEFQHFASPSLGALLSGARKYGVGLVLAHQELRQIRDADLESAVLTNPSTRICFRLGDEDARKLERGFESFTAEDLGNLRTGEAICRVGPRDHDFNLLVAKPKDGDRAEARERRERLVRASRERFGTPRAEVARLLDEILKRPAAVEPEAAAEVAAPAIEAPGEPENRTPGNGKKARPQKTGEREVPRVRRVREDDRATAEAGTPGRGGSQHKYLQSLIRHYAQELGFQAAIEHALPGGGRIDVLLHGPMGQLACEVSITTKAEDELGNIEKCLHAGIVRIAVISPERRKLKTLETAARARLPHESLSRVSFLTPQDLFEVLSKEGETTPPKDSTVLGYRVRRSVRTLNSSELEERRRTIADIVLRGLRRTKPE
jgi:DNA helicase HerA-like ATPase